VSHPPVKHAVKTSPAWPALDPRKTRRHEVLREPRLHGPPRLVADTESVGREAEESHARIGTHQRLCVRAADAVVAPDEKAAAVFQDEIVGARVDVPHTVRSSAVQLDRAGVDGDVGLVSKDVSARGGEMVDAEDLGRTPARAL